ncbi:AsmA family protein [Methylobacterium oryzihabitans]|uniref:AsmA family protein n=1 Tax=Methylobacterium oryzihabitans TaxID=2499852 RepID=A0A3S2VRB1_9HYPH|nr:AsmA family protein [Methylobacterium oryzihabitans]RVU15348.1 AsmA family protein [Methylobacterium oryzihabitans]
MRDILTALAGLVILILAAALAMPPLVGWESYRGTVDGALSRSLGLEVRTEGRLQLRLLPLPRLRADRLVLAAGPGQRLLDARVVRAEVALPPLLSGEIRFTEARIGRAEIRLPVTEAGAVVLPPGLAGAARRDLAVEDLRIGQLLLTTTVPATGRTDQLSAESVGVSAPALAGPWRIEGSHAGVPFRLATGTPGPDGAVPAKLSAGGDTAPRIEVDARLSLAADGRVPEAAGTAKLVVGPPAQAAGADLPFSLQGSFKARGRVATFDSLALEIDGGGAPLRLAGRGSLDLAAARASLVLAARRLDLDAFLTGPAGRMLLAGEPGRLAARLPGTVSLDVSVESATLALGEWTDLGLGATLAPTGALALHRLDATAPGGVRLGLGGDLGPGGGFAGRASVTAPDSARLARLLDRVGLGGPVLRLLDGRPVSASADITAAPPVVSLRNARLALGEARITGNARYVAAGPDAPRPRFDAQIAAEAFDIAELPSLRGGLDALRGHDLGLTLTARDLRYGPAGPRTGEIAASLQSEGAALRVDSLEIRDLAGARASLSGRIAPDGTGRIAGRVSAPVAAPLIDLFQNTLVAEARALPDFLRRGAVSLDVTVEREPGADEPRLRSAARGTAAGGQADLALVTRDGRIEGLDARLDGLPSGLWLGRPADPALARPARLRLSGRREPGAGGDEAGRALGLTVEADLAGLAVTTARPLVVAPGESLPRDGEVAVASPDLTPFAGFLGRGALGGGAVPARLTLAFGRAGPLPRLTLAGSVAGSAVEGAILRGTEGGFSGDLRLDRLSLPWLAGALVLADGGEAAGNGLWPGARFGPAPPPLPGLGLGLAVRRLDLGRGLAAAEARFGLALGPEGLTVRDMQADLAGGRLTGTATLARQGEQATVSGQGILAGASLAAIVGSPAGGLAGSFGARLRFGAAGTSPAGLIGNLAGSGEITLADLVVPGLDPAAPERALGRLLAEDDPLRSGRVERVLAEEFDRGPLRVSAPVTVAAALVGGVLRTSGLTLDAGASSWTGGVLADLRSLRLDARGTMTAARTPRAWTGPAPLLGLALAGPIARPAREIDAAPLTNLLAAVVLQRELDAIESGEADRNELARRRSRLEMDRARAAEEADRLRRQAMEEADRVRRQAMEEADRLRRQAEEARLRAAQEAAEAARRARQAAEEEARRRKAEEERLRVEAEARRRAEEAAPAPEAAEP